MERVSSLATARLSGKPEELKDVITLICSTRHTFQDPSCWRKRPAADTKSHTMMAEGHVGVICMSSAVFVVSMSQVCARCKFYASWFLALHNVW